MATFTIEEICQATGAKICSRDKTQVFTGIATDSRKILPGNLFVALHGENFDGHGFVEQAVEQGAAGVLVDREVDLSAGSVLQCDDTLTALQDIAAFHRRRFEIPVIAVTGSNGKTTTKDMLAAILSQKFQVVKTPGNFNNEIGLPLTLLQLNDETEVAVVECGMRGRGQITALAQIARPTAGIVTTVGETHLELLGSLENIAAAKAELVEAIDENGFVVLNSDNSYVAAMKDVASCPVITFGLQSQAMVRAENWTSSAQGITFDCITEAGKFHVDVPVLGDHNVMNALAAIAVGKRMGLTAGEIVRGLAHFIPSAMRMAVEQAGPYQVINDAYNASPASMKSALETLQRLPGGRKVAVLGDMLELGEHTADAHRRVGEVAAGAVDFLVTYGDLGRFIAEGAKTAGLSQVFPCDSHAAAIRILKENLLQTDLILVKGSRGMKMEKIIAALGQQQA